MRNSRYGLRGVSLGEASNPGPPGRRVRESAEEVLDSLERELTLIESDDEPRTHTDTNGRRRSHESLSESSITTNWNPDVHESSILEWKPWSDRAMHTDTLGTTSNLTNTDGRQIFEVANHNDSSDCRLGPFDMLPGF